jgi:DNA-binding beta-propeller fold protein YncE
MNSKRKSSIRAACHAFGGMILLITFSAQAQNLYVSVYGNGSIIKITPGGVESTFASGLSGPAGLAFNSAGDLFASTYNGLCEFSPGGAQIAFPSGAITPWGLAINSAGNLFVSGAEIGSYSRNIYEFTPGGMESVFASGGDPIYISMAFNSAGDLFAPEYGGDQLLEFTPGGVESTFAYVADAQYLAFQPVPEPSVLSLLTVGAAALIVHRRKLAA